LRYLSVCSGIEAATVAWHPLGWTAAAYSEIEKFPSQVLAHHYPNTPNVGDMTKFKEWNIGSIDLLVGGTPCQSFSVAGLRKGLDDPRGNLMLTYLAIADQHRPRWLVWENVPGVLSSNGGKDFGVFLGALGELGYGFAYRILDAQFFGVAQRRRRVFVVGYLGDWRAAAAVLFERHSLSGDSAPSREKRKEAASGVTHGLGDGGECARALTASNSATGRLDPHESTYVSQPIALQDITSREKAQNGKGWNADGSAYTVDTHATQGVAQPIPFDTTQITSKANYSKPESGDPCHPLAAGAHPPAIAQPISFSGQMSNPYTDVDLMQTLQAKNPMAVAVGVPDVMCTLRASGAGFDRTGNSATEHETYIPIGAFKPGQSAQAHSIGYEDEMAPTLEAGTGGNNKPAVHVGMAVRRLTPVECERLQGFPDNYTDIQPKGKATPDGPRYKALGNSMAVPVMAWIGKRIQEVENLQCKPNK
jgi:DNA (cytosine-5)-methyltransferase 1